ncbi:MAG: hypothetical protein QXV62_03080 [Nitrososphaerota archaeon]
MFVTFPLFRDEEKKLLKVVLDATKVDRPYYSGLEQLENIVGSHFSDSLKREYGSIFSRYFSSFLGRKEYTIKLCLDDLHVVEVKEGDLPLYLNKRERGFNILERTTSMVVTGETDSLELLCVAHLICSLQLLSSLMEFGGSALRAGLKNDWDEINLNAIMCTHHIGLNWDLLRQVFEHGGEVLGRIKEKMIMQQKLYLLDGEKENRWICLKMRGFGQAI